MIGGRMKFCVGLNLGEACNRFEIDKIKILATKYDLFIAGPTLGLETATVVESRDCFSIINQAKEQGYELIMFIDIKHQINFSKLDQVLAQLDKSTQLVTSLQNISERTVDARRMESNQFKLDNCLGNIYKLSLIDQFEPNFKINSNQDCINFNTKYLNRVETITNISQNLHYIQTATDTELLLTKGLTIIAKQQVIEQLQMNPNLDKCDSQYELITVERFNGKSINKAIDKARFNKVMFINKKFNFREIAFDRLIADIQTDDSNTVLVPIVHGENSIRDGQYPNLYLKENIVRNNGNVCLMSIFDTSLTAQVGFQVVQNKSVTSHKFLLNYMMCNHQEIKLIGDYNIISEQRPLSSNLSTTAKELINESQLEISSKIPYINNNEYFLDIKQANQEFKIVCAQPLSNMQKYLINYQLFNINSKFIDGAYFVNQDNEIAGVIFFADTKFNTKSFVRIDAQYNNTSEVKLATLIDFDINQSHLNIEGYDLSKDKKYMAFIAGDENIGLGALVAFHSLRKHNPKIDCKLYTYVERLEQYLVEEFRLLEVELVDINAYIKQVDIMNSQTIAGMTWPPEVFINYLIPTLNTNYDYAIKLDYDVLVLGELELDLITPHPKQLLSSINNLYSCYNMNKIKQSKKLYDQNYKLDYEHMKKTGINTGFVVFDIKSYTSYDVFNQMLKVYQNVYSLDQQAGELIYADQGLLNLTIDILNIKFKVIDTKYNLTTTNCRVFKGNDIILIHYTGVVKPWKVIELNEEYMETKGNMNIFMTYYWLQYVNENLPSLKEKFETNFDQIFMRAALDLFQSKIK